jgi:acetoacetyl-CoA reductase
MQGKVALVTGGTGGIGTAVCQELAKRGCKVAANYLEGVDDGLGWQAKQKEQGFDFVVVPGNVSDYDSSVAMVQAVAEKLGPVDILVNCAGITKDGTLKKMKKEQWYDVINVNLNSVFNATKPVIDSMLDRGVEYGRIINISSVNGQKGQLGQTNYSAAKAGMHGFTMALAQEVARKKITVNTVSPGYIATAMVMAIPEDVRNKIIATVPVGRLAEPSEIAHTVAFLADERSGFITGANIAINGGLHMGP